MIYNKTRQLFYVSADRQTFFGFEMTANLRDTSPVGLDVSLVLFFNKSIVAKIIDKPLNIYSTVHLSLKGL